MADTCCPCLTHASFKLRAIGSVGSSIRRDRSNVSSKALQLASPADFKYSRLARASSRGSVAPAGSQYCSTVAQPEKPAWISAAFSAAKSTAPLPRLQNTL